MGTAMVSDQPVTQPSVDNSSKVDAKFQFIACVCCSGGRWGQGGGVWTVRGKETEGEENFILSLLSHCYWAVRGGSIILSSSSTLGPNSHLLLSYSYTITMYILQLPCKMCSIVCVHAFLYLKVVYYQSHSISCFH